MLDGDLLTGPLEQVLLDLGAQGSTGCLHVMDDGEEEAEVYFRDGMVYSVFVPGRRPLIGSRLISSGVLAPETLAEALEIQRSGELVGWRLGELLVHLGFVEREVVESFVSEQLVDQLTDLMGWRVDSWKFRPRKLARQDVSPPQEVHALLAEIRERRMRWEQMRGLIGTAESVPVLSSSGSTSDDVLIGPGEWAMLCKVDGERSIADLAIDCGFTLYEGAQVVSSLVEAGLVDVDRTLTVVPDPVVEEPFEDVVDDAVHDATDAGTDDATDDHEEAALAESVRRAADQLEEVLLPELEPEPEVPPAPAPISGYSDLEWDREEAIRRAIAEKEAQSQLDDEKRRRLEALAIAAEVEEARQRELARIKKKRRATLDVERAAAEPQAWADHALWLADERARAEDAARAEHAAYLAEQARVEAERLAAERAAAEEPAWADHVQWLAAERARVEWQAWDDHAAWTAERLAELRRQAEDEAWADHRAWLDAQRAGAEEPAWADHGAWLAAERARVEGEAWETHLAWLSDERFRAEGEAWDAHAAWLWQQRVDAEEPAWAAHRQWLSEQRTAAEPQAWAEHAEFLVEQARLEAERARIEAERAEAERLAAEEAAVAEAEEAERVRREEQARLDREEAERLEAERLAAEETQRAAAAEAERVRREEQEQAAREAAERAEAAAAAMALADLARGFDHDEEPSQPPAHANVSNGAGEAADDHPYESQPVTIAVSPYGGGRGDGMSPAALLSELNRDASRAVAEAIREDDHRTQAEPVPEPERERELQPVANVPSANGDGRADTAALLRELSGLFASGDEPGNGYPSGNGSGGGPSSPPPAPHPAPRPAAKDEKKKKRGIFGR